jgi:hypothetical protein
MYQVIGKSATEQNGRMEGIRSFGLSTRQELADWLNLLAAKQGIAKSPSNPNGYFATAENIG